MAGVTVYPDGIEVFAFRNDGLRPVIFKNSLFEEVCTRERRG